MKRILISTLAVAGLLGFASPAFAATAYPLGTVNIRSGPSTQNTVIGSLTDGQTAAVLSHDGNWLKVQAGDGTVGYMADWVTREVFDDATYYLQVNTDVLNVRTSPDLAAAVLGQVKQGQQMQLLEGLGGWYKVNAGSLGTGWVKAEFTTRIAPPPSSGGRTPPPDKQPGAPAQEGLTKTIQAVRAAPIYNGRTTEYDVVTNTRAWETLTYLDSAEGWFKVRNANGDQGWIQGTDVVIFDQGVAFANAAIYNVVENDWSMKFYGARQVVPDGGGLAVRSGPSQDSPALRTLDAGNIVKLLAVPGGEYVQVMLADGLTGWVSRNYLMMVPGAPSESARLYQSSPGVLRLEVGGAVSGVSVSGTVLNLGLPANTNRKAALTVAEHEISSMTMNAGGLAVRFDQPFSYQVVEQSASRTVLEIRPVISAVELQSAADRDIYRFHLTGALDPTVVRSGDTVVMNLPGAKLDPAATVPAGLTLQASDTGLVARVTSPRNFIIKRGADYFDLQLEAAGLAGKTIVVDPGHGGSETGAVGPNGTLEKNDNLAIAMKLKTLLEGAGARVVMTRTGDTRCASPDDLAKLVGDDQLHYDLGCRSQVANTIGADLFISIHNNANPDASLRGTETYYSLGNMNSARSQDLANYVQAGLLSGLGLQDLKVKHDVFYVTKFTDAPAILAEVAFISNPTEEQLLGQAAFQQKAAQSIFTGITRFFQ